MQPEIRLAHRVKQLKPSPTLAMSAQASQLRAQGIQILDMSLGEPDFPTPAPIREAAARAIEEGWTKYTAVAGMMPLRERICTHLQERGFDFYTPESILVSTGAKQCLYNAIMALIGPGDEVLIPAPYWVSYPTQVELAGGTPVFVPSRLEEHFQIDPDAIEAAITPYTRMLILNSPNNPTGAVYEEDRLKRIVEILQKHKQIWLLADEIYDQLVYGEARAISPLLLEPELRHRTILINGFSKAYAMTGWRMGYMAAPAPIIKASVALQGACTSGANTITQRAAIAALDLDKSVIDEMRATFAKRLQVMKEGFGRIPKLRVPVPSGAFYMMPDFSAYLGMTTPQDEIMHTTIDLSRYFLHRAHVAAVPGEAFGAPGTIRFSYATDVSTIQEVIKRIQTALKQLS